MLYIEMSAIEANAIEANAIEANAIEANAIESIVKRALDIVKSNPEWIAYVKDFNQPNGFLFCDDLLLSEICNAIDLDNPIHSGSSIALCLQQCKHILNDKN